MTTRKPLLLFLLLFAFPLANPLAASAAEKPKLTLDEFFNSVSFDGIRLAPDGRSVLIATERADWDQNIFRKELWLYREGSLTPLTQSGRDYSPQWSPDGKWIAFLSEREPAKGGNSCEENSKGDEVDQLYLISPRGGEAIQVTQGEETVHAFAWSADSSTLYYSTRQPWTKAQKEAYSKEWKDVCQYRAAERGDTIFSVNVAEAVARRLAAGTKPSEDSENGDVTPGSRAVAVTQWRANELAASPDGRRLAFASTSISQREEKVDEFEIYTVDLADASPSHPPRQVTHNQAQEQNIHWAHDSKHVFFMVEEGSVEGAYKDTQPRLYWVDADTGEATRWAADFDGAVTGYSVARDGVLVTGRLGTEVQLYSQAKPDAPFVKQAGWAGTYEMPAAADASRTAFVFSTLQKPTEVYLVESPEKLQDAKPITSFNQLFTERDLPQGKTYHWTADDGTNVEGMLMYPPGKFGEKNLPMFVFIHGGPNDADGNHFEADWYVWDRLAATQGWLVFEPNYRGSTGYGDKFLEQIVPQIVSRPGKDILEGVDALVKDGLADPNEITIGGYSYGGYMTNWLITQSTRWKAAVTGAGAVENVANWGNDDTTFDDAYFLGGLPWVAQQRYHDEAAIFQINKVRTPTHMVAGEDDIRVAVLEDYLLDHALHVLNIPSTLLIFPGEGHSLDKNPWHGKIKVREELKWLAKYGGIAAAK
jgi:acylaminoacyl-peptidase